MKPDFDVAIIGGGQAGSTAAPYVAAAGLSVAVFESEMFPRERLGESLVPATTSVRTEIGVMPEIEVEKNPDHLWHPYLGTLRAPSAAPTF